MATDSMQQLSQQIEKKKEKDREQIEQHTLSELKRHARNLRSGLSEELDTTKAGISDQLNQITSLIDELETNTRKKRDSVKKSLNADLNTIQQKSRENRQAATNSLKWGWIKYSLPALLIFAGIFAGSWGLMEWQSSRLMESQNQIQEAQRTLDQLPTNVQFARESGSNYLIFKNGEPNLYQTESGAWLVKLKQQ